ncbi:MAG: YbjN domain-containing protein [Phenylobacterium sp.]|uniref:YbjN domain-containing protein n=1 Tax=Phenylobacterium sp. TaxID=1871053 RepID=UPI0027252BAD|nr:YbjN domain-containing protein [Phenylobacterium sp.]MDO8902804.1 YbjN domain-containing protein [Phenylobacterium sp.]MDP2215521.1 YbjN domain-containing protein [Phenylobacterium sp.]
MRGLWIVAGLALGLGTAQAQARPLPPGGVTAAEVIEVLQAKGYRGQADVDGVGDPMVRSATDGTNFVIYFYGCERERCTTIQFGVGFEMNRSPGLAKINEWNREMRFGRAYLDSDMDPFVEMDVDLELGATTEQLQSVIGTWTALVPAFKEFIDF